MKIINKYMQLFILIMGSMQICAMDSQESQMSSLQAIPKVNRVAAEQQTRWQRNKNITDLVMNSDWCKNNVLDMLGGYVACAEGKKPYFIVSVNRTVAPWVVINKEREAILQAVKNNDYEAFKKSCRLLDACTSLFVSPKAAKSSDFIKKYKSNNNFNFLDISISHDNVDVTKLLLFNCEFKEAFHLKSWNPLHISAFFGKVRVAKLLLDCGTNINIRSESGKTPLHIGACSGKLEIVRFLLRHGADTEIKDNYGHTPDQVTLSREIKNMIVQARIDSAQRSRAGYYQDDDCRIS